MHFYVSTSSGGRLYFFPTLALATLRRFYIHCIIIASLQRLLLGILMLTVLRSERINQPINNSVAKKYKKLCNFELRIERLINAYDIDMPPLPSILMPLPERNSINNRLHHHHRPLMVKSQTTC